MNNSVGEYQYQLYFAVFLVDLDKNVLIPDFWCSEFDLAAAINGLLNRNTNRLIFYSPNANKEPDFTLAVRTKMDLNSDGCYFGKLLRAFSK